MSHSYPSWGNCKGPLPVRYFKVTYPGGDGQYRAADGKSLMINEAPYPGRWVTYFPEDHDNFFIVYLGTEEGIELLRRECNENQGIMSIVDEEEALRGYRRT